VVKVNNSYEYLARRAAERMDRVRASGQQLQLLPDEAGVPVADAAKGVGRPKGAINKGSSELRRWLARQGYRMPEDQIAQMAGLSSSDPAIIQAMERTEAVLAWAFAEAKDKDGSPREAAPEQKVALMMGLLAIMERAAAALLPYGTPKASPDVTVQQAVQIVMPQAASASSDARDITPRSASKRMPADVRWEMEQKQRVTDGDEDGSDDEIRTGGASD